MERTQFKFQREWLTDPNTTNSDVLIMYANWPGEIGFPLPTGETTMWLPAIQLVGLWKSNYVVTDTRLSTLASN